jgi:hypothetical protein
MMTQIRNHDVVKVKSTNKISRIIDIHYAFDRYQIKGVSGWQYGIQDLEKLDTDSLITTIESQKEEIEKAVAEAKYQVELTLEFNRMHTEISLRETDLRNEMDRLKAITELAVKGLEEIKLMLDMDHSDYQKFVIWKKACDSLTEMALMKNAQT